MVHENKKKAKTMTKKYLENGERFIFRWNIYSLCQICLKHSLLEINFNFYRRLCTIMGRERANESESYRVGYTMVLIHK